MPLELNDGEVYGGVILNESFLGFNEPSASIILLPNYIDGVNWVQAIEWARRIGGCLPSIREQLILFVNLKSHFGPNFYWSHELDHDFAWYTNFFNGQQKSIKPSSKYLSARAIRKVPLQ